MRVYKSFLIKGGRVFTDVHQADNLAATRAKVAAMDFEIAFLCGLSVDAQFEENEKRLQLDEQRLLKLGFSRLDFAQWERNELIFQNLGLGVNKGFVYYQFQSLRVLDVLIKTPA